MPSRAARWISAITLRSKRADSRRPGLPAAALISTPRVVDREVVELPRRAVAAEVRRVDVVDPGALEQLAHLRDVLVAHLLLDAVGAEPGDRAAHVEPRLVDRVAERIAGVAADDEAARLRHERAQVPDRAADDDVDALHRDAAARRGVAVDDEQPAVRGRARRLADAAVDDDDARHHVLGDPGARVAAHAHRRVLVHAGAVVADVAVDLDLELGVEPARDGVRTLRVDDPPAARAARP